MSKFVAAIGIEFLHASHQSQTAFLLDKIVKGNAERPIDFYLCAPYLMCCHSYKPHIVFNKTVQRIHVPGLRQRTQFSLSTAVMFIFCWLDREQTDQCLIELF